MTEISLTKNREKQLGPGSISNLWRARPRGRGRPRRRDGVAGVRVAGHRRSPRREAPARPPALELELRPPLRPPRPPLPRSNSSSVRCSRTSGPASASSSQGRGQPASSGPGRRRRPAGARAGGKQLGSGTCGRRAWGGRPRPPGPRFRPPRRLRRGVGDLRARGPARGGDLQEREQEGSSWATTLAVGERGEDGRDLQDLGSGLRVETTVIHVRGGGGRRRGDGRRQQFTRVGKLPGDGFPFCALSLVSSTLELTHKIWRL